MHKRNLLLLVALCCVAPASAVAHKACHDASAAPLATPVEGGGGDRLFDPARSAFLP